MSRPLRLEYPGSLWHVTARGNENRDIYRDDNDRVRFLEILGEAVAEYRWILTAYALMSSEYCFVVELTEKTLSDGMQWLDSQYARWFNWRYNRVGHLYQGRFEAILVEKETYFLKVLRDVVLSPVRAGIAERPAAYQWSSHLAVTGAVPSPSWLAVDDVLSQFPAIDARALYTRFVDEGVGSSYRPWDELAGQIYLGSKEWLTEIRERVQQEPRSLEHPLAQRQVIRPTMDAIISTLALTLRVPQDDIRTGRGIPRMTAAWVGRNFGRLHNDEIAAALRFRSAGHVTRLVQRCDQELKKSAALRRCVDQCVSTLGRKQEKVKI